MTAVAVIPARGGSKRVPRKNVRDFNGRPMIAWPIATAIASGAFDRVVVSTDDDEIAAAAEAAGAEVPFRRPADLADDHTPTVPVIAHAVGELGLADDRGTAVCCIYPATPLLTSADLHAGLAAWHQRPGRFAFCAYDPGLPICRAVVVGDDGAAAWLAPEHARTRSQDLPRTLLDAGWYYVGAGASWASAVSILEGATPVEIDRARAVDIDTEEDWQRAAALAAGAGGSVPSRR